MAERLRKTYQEKRRPTPAQERALEEVRWRWRLRYNTALEPRRTGWRRGQGRWGTRSPQEAERKERRAAFPD